jgi:hypothetical protein
MRKIGGVLPTLPTFVEIRGKDRLIRYLHEASMATDFSVL